MIRYDYGKKKVRQVLGTIDRYDLEGDFHEAVNRFADEYASYKEYLDEPHEIPERSGYGKSMYLDGVDNKTIKFDKLYLDWQDTYDNEKELQVVGERDMDASELAAYDAELEKQKQREIEQLKKLKEKYPDA
jgi:hypothetical protein